MKDRFAVLAKKQSKFNGLIDEKNVVIDTDLDVDEIQDTNEKLVSDFTKRAKAETERFNNAVTLDYYVNIYFADPHQKAEFLEVFKLAEHLMGGQYLSGQTVSTAIESITGYKMPNFEKVEPPRQFRKSKELQKFNEFDFI